MLCSLNWSQGKLSPPEQGAGEGKHPALRSVQLASSPLNCTATHPWPPSIWRGRPSPRPRRERDLEGAGPTSHGSWRGSPVLSQKAAECCPEPRAKSAALPLRALCSTYWRAKNTLALPKAALESPGELAVGTRYPGTWHN